MVSPQTMTILLYILMSLVIWVPSIHAFHKNLFISQPSVVSISGYQDPLYIGHAQLRESHHNGVIALNIKPGHYQISSPINKDSNTPQIQVEPGIGTFYSNTNLSYPIWVDKSNWVSLGNISIQVSISGYYSCMATYRLLQHPSPNDIPISLDNQLLVNLRLDQQIISSQPGAKGRYYQKKVFLNQGKHHLQLSARLTTSSCYPRIKHQFCEPIRFALLPSAGNGFQSLVYLGLWKQSGIAKPFDSKTFDSKTSNLSPTQNGLIKNVQGHLHYLLPERVSPNLDIDLF